MPKVKGLRRAVQWQLAAKAIIQDTRKEDLPNTVCKPNIAVRCILCMTPQNAAEGTGQIHLKSGKLACGLEDPAQCDVFNNLRHVE